MFDVKEAFAYIEYSGAKSFHKSIVLRIFATIGETTSFNNVEETIPFFRASKMRTTLDWKFKWSPMRTKTRIKMEGNSFRRRSGVFPAVIEYWEIIVDFKFDNYDIRAHWVNAPRFYWFSRPEPVSVGG